MLSSEQLATAAVPEDVQTTIFTVAAGHRVILRDVRVHGYDSVIARLVVLWVETNAGIVVTLIYENAPAGAFVAAISDAFVVLEEGDKVRCFTDAGEMSAILSGHDFTL